MSLKVKLTSLITTFILLCLLLTVGVFAVKNTSFNVGGDIVFNVQGIEADIELTANGLQNAVLADNAVAGTDVMNKIEIRNNTSADSIAQKFAKWSNLDLTFAEGQTTATIELKITNKASEEDNYIDITALADATTKNNAKIKVENNAGGITALLKSGEDATFTITFSVIDDGYSASLNGFSVNFDMQKKVLADFPVLSADMTYQTLKFRTIDGQSGLSVEDIGSEDNYYESTGDLIIPAYVNNDGSVCPVTTIAAAAFGVSAGGMGNSITKISIPNTITSIGGDAFSYCENLTSVTIPDGVTSIGSGAFSYCESLTSVVIGNGVTSIITAAFYCCRSLKSIIIPDSVTSIGESAFQSCYELTSVTIPDSVTSIGDSSFDSCRSLTSITIPDGVTSIGYSAFYGCSNLTTVNYTGTQEEWSKIQGLANASIPSGATIHYEYTGE